jgi:hypothetical protein
MIVAPGIVEVLVAVSAGGIVAVSAGVGGAAQAASQRTSRINAAQSMIRRLGFMVIWE